MNNTPKIPNAGIIVASGKVALILERLGVTMEARHLNLPPQLLWQ
jgi:hypothetical protein